jgi:hypothetical protein
MKRYFCIRRRAEDQLLLHALIQLDLLVSVIHITGTSHTLEQDEIHEREYEVRSQAP